MNPLTISAWKDMCSHTNEQLLLRAQRSHPSTGPEERDITDPEFRRGLERPGTPPLRAFPSIIPRARWNPPGNACVISTFRVQCAVIADNPYDPSLYIVNEVGYVDTEHLEESTEGSDIDSEDARTLVDSENTHTFVDSENAHTFVDSENAHTFVDSEQHHEGASLFCNARFTAFVKAVFRIVGRADVDQAQTGCEEEIDLNPKVVDEQPTGLENMSVKVDLQADEKKHGYSFEAVSESKVDSVADYWKESQVSRFFDEKNKVLIWVMKDQGVRLHFENGLVLDLPAAIVPIVRIPTASGFTLVYDVAEGKPLDSKCQGWEGVETVKERNTLTT
ncbi:hypothetical protein EST38_g7805 [Candolleomyces aberdarensis]|uniref:Uncharacterized protein n=1 Tax=Candolleomyces aberdarensis TaxID=2316362 RepID=A0A4Q2DG82_9AGAR|nr:hypothetical protein EST38_g7805 [Candolleomyces aberdarensis]